jgi:phospholipid/cholesterol/gamma-HCH transport system substrate-binding protein
MPFGIRRSNTDSDGVRIPRKDRRGINPVTAGLIALIVIVVGTYFGFTKHIPFTHDFRVKAVFQSSNSLRLNSPVRIAGVNVGKVTKIERYADTDMALVTLEVKDAGLPIHKDATAKIRPRIFLEGNYFVDLKPGSPSAPTLEDDDQPLKVTQTATPVQLDEVLSVLQEDSRTDLKALLDGFGNGLTHKPTTLEDARSHPITRGQSAAESLNDAIDYGADAFRGTAIVNQALLGERPDDLSRLISSFGKVAGGLSANEEQLKDLITNFNTTVGALASEQGNLRASIRELGPTLTAANRAFASLNAAFPPTRAWAREMLPGVRETAATINASFPWMEQTSKLLGPAELQGVARQARPTTVSLAALTNASLELFPQVELAAKCVTKVILPTGDVVIQDGNLTTGKENYKEFWYTMVGLAGEGQNFDGNGMYVRFQPGGGTQTVSTGKVNGVGAPLLANVQETPIGSRPVYPGKRPPYKPNATCYKQTPPDLNGPAAAIGPAETKVADNPAPSAPAGAVPQITLPNVALPRSSSRTTKQAGTTSGGAKTASGPSVAETLADTLNPFRARRQAGAKGSGR